jgi:hypothetical protein
VGYGNAVTAQGCKVMSQTDKRKVRTMVMLAVAKNDNDMRESARRLYWEMAI